MIDLDKVEIMDGDSCVECGTDLYKQKFMFSEGDLFYCSQKCFIRYNRPEIEKLERITRIKDTL